MYKSKYTILQLVLATIIEQQRTMTNPNGMFNARVTQIQNQSFLFP
jgi:hypothetical protein